MTHAGGLPTGAPFAYELATGRVVFGAGQLAALRDEIDRIGGRRLMVVADGPPALRALTAGALDALGDRVVERWDAVVQHVPVDLAAQARDTATDACVDTLIAVGGGSAIGLAKAIALTHGIPIVAIPTTYAGSEMTDIYGLTGGDGKQTGRDRRVKPCTVIYDPLLTVGLPPRVTGASAFNALAHAVEALYAPNANPVTNALAVEAVRLIAAGMRLVGDSPEDVEARSVLFAGAHLAAIALAATSMGLHHKLCHVLGGMLDIVHADAHSVLLPFVVAYNQPYAEEAIAMVGGAVGADAADTAGAVWDLAAACGLPTSLAAIGVNDDDVQRISGAVAATTGPNPGPVTEAAVARLLAAALAGARP